MGFDACGSMLVAEIGACESSKIGACGGERIIVRNSSKLRTPSPLRSNLPIMAWQSLVDLDSPSRLSILFKLVGVMQPDPSISYIPKASLSSTFLSSSPPASISFWNSSKSICPSPFKSHVFTAASASSIDISLPTVTTQLRNSEGDILPSPSSSNSLQLFLLALEPVCESEFLSAFLLGDNLRRNLPKANFFGELELVFSSNIVIGVEEEEAASRVVFMIKPGLIEGTWVYS
ncbi:hypothetical protein CFP56_021132 [Quercus suber]|uniref:Uncharacterized protein n=1 Tax=Quercus suber TaxID=58331 RepID=A0AAW0KGH1_QUESU